MASSGKSGGGLAVVLVLLLGVAAWLLQEASDDNAPRDAGSRESGHHAKQHPGMPDRDESSGLPYVALADLPPEAADVVALIDQGGPFAYDKDGSTFGNYEGLLPDREEGYYREYTVETPGSPDRGARRIIGGAEGELYWTEDHYESFEVIWR